MKKIKRFLIAAVMIALAAGVIRLAGYGPLQKLWGKVAGSFETKVSIADVITNGINEENKLITAVVYTECAVEIDSTWFRKVFLIEDIFKKTQAIKFHGEALYTIDLKLLKSGDIYYGGFGGGSENENESPEKITAYIPAPQFSYICINPAKTDIEKTNNGFMRTGDMTFTADDFREIETTVIEMMAKNLENDEEARSELEKIAKAAVKEFITNILSSGEYKTYEVFIEFKEE